MAFRSVAWGTPLPPWTYLGGRIGSAVWIAALAVVMMLGVGALAYGLEIRAAVVNVRSSLLAVLPLPSVDLTW